MSYARLRASENLENVLEVYWCPLSLTSALYTIRRVLFIFLKDVIH